MPRGRGKIPQQVGNPQNRYGATASEAAQAARPTQPVRTPTGKGYGEAKALSDAQRAAPLPERAPVPRPTPRRVAGTLTPEVAVAYTPPNLGLRGPSTRPQEPITAGAPVGPGPGPQRRFDSAALLAGLASATGDEAFALMAELADIQGF